MTQPRGAWQIQNENKPAVGPRQRLTAPAGLASTPSLDEALGPPFASPALVQTEQAPGLQGRDPPQPPSAPQGGHPALAAPHKAAPGSGIGFVTQKKGGKEAE